MKAASTINGSGSAIVTAHYLATEAGARVLADGGNAVDAALCANAVLGVVAPETCGPGGDLFALVHQAGRVEPAVLNASGRAGAGAAEAAAELRRRGLERAPYTEPSSITAPGCVDGWTALADAYGSRELADLLGPAIEYAETGFPASTELVRAFTMAADQLSGQPSAASLLPGGQPPSPGDTLRRRDLANTLRGLAEGGRDAFYTGPTAQTISSATGGILTTADLEARHAEWVEPISVDLFGESAWTVPPNSQGYLTFAAAKILESLAPDPDDADFLHLMIEAYRSVAFERDDLVADPDHAPLSGKELVSFDRLQTRSRAIDRSRAGRWPAPHPAPGGTTYLCGADHQGLSVSLIQSNFTGLGSRITAGRTGIFLHNRGAGFTTKQGHPNEMLPGKRPLHTLSPTLWTKDGQLTLLLGTRGGHQQPQFLLQAICQVHLLEKGPEAALEAFRWAIDDGSDTASHVRIESRAPQSTVDQLEARGHRVEKAQPFEPGWGPISMIRADGGGGWTAAADPRVDTTSAVVL